jgi:hypothetical protein
MSERASSAVHSRVFYGYIVVGAALVMMTVSSGAMFSYSVFFAPLQHEFGWNRVVTSAAFSVNMVVQGLFSLGVGRLTTGSVLGHIPCWDLLGGRSYWSKGSAASGSCICFSAW